MSAHGNILLIDDDQELRDVIREELERRGYGVVGFDSAEQARSRLEDPEIGVVLTDVDMGAGMSGIELCESVAAIREDLPVVVMTGFGTVETAIAAIRAGAYDFIVKPFEIDALTRVVDRALKLHALRTEVRSLRKEMAGARAIPNLIVGDSPPMRRMLELISRVAGSDATTLVMGESGTGKELVARAIHGASARHAGPFVAINCAAMPENLLESELFGHSKGAFTDARTSRPGLFLNAHGGTLLLDEIGEMPPGMQAKLLRALQQRTVRPVGSDDEVPFDVRIIAATHRDLEAEVQAKRFREDLYYRVNVVCIHVPPLRSRGHDILTLATQFLVGFMSTSNRGPLLGFTPAVADKMLNYPWPGNVRELQNCVERACALAQGDRVALQDLPEKVREYKPTRSEVLPIGNDPTTMPRMDEIERRYIRQVLDAVSGNKSLAAQILGVDRRTIYRKLERIRSEPPENGGSDVLPLR